MAAGKVAAAEQRAIGKRSLTVDKNDASSAGIGLGSAIAVVISYTKWHSIGWAIVHGMCSWFYVVWAFAKGY